MPNLFRTLPFSQPSWNTYITHSQQPSSLWGLPPPHAGAYPATLWGLSPHRLRPIPQPSGAYPPTLWVISSHPLGPIPDPLGPILPPSGAYPPTLLGLSPTLWGLADTYLLTISDATLPSVVVTTKWSSLQLKVIIPLSPSSRSVAVTAGTSSQVCAGTICVDMYGC